MEEVEFSQVIGTYYKSTIISVFNFFNEKLNQVIFTRHFGASFTPLREFGGYQN